MHALMGSLLLAAPFANAQEAAILQKTSGDFESVAEKAIPAVVSIQVKAQPTQTKSLFDYDPSPEEEFFGRFFGIPRRDTQPKDIQVSQASGFLISPDGYILTNNHVVNEGVTITVKLNDGREFSGKVIGTDESTDIALLKIEGSDLPYLKLGNSDALKIGQWVVAIGNPLGLQASLTVGVVSAKGRSNLDIARIEDFIQTDAAINRGNSGGPLLNLNAEVVGMNTAIATNLASGGYMGIGFAIPSNMASHVMEQLKNDGSVSRGYLGVMLQPIDSELAKAFDLPKVSGALVAEILKDSPAEKAGLKQGDIILSYNGTVVENVGGLRNFIALQSPGTKIKLSIIRDKKPLEIEFAVAEMQKPGATKGNLNSDALGLEVQTLTKELAANLRRPDDEGVLVIQVKPGTPAAMVGLKKGALIVSVNNKKVITSEAFLKEVSETPKGKPVVFLVKQGETMRFISIALP
jgi:serine protease Do